VRELVGKAHDGSTQGSCAGALSVRVGINML
jgi:hypothetical protein